MTEPLPHRPRRAPPSLHARLRRQLRRASADPTQAPTPEGWTALVRALDRAYRKADAERECMIQARDAACREMVVVYEVLRGERDAAEHRTQQRTEALRLSEARLTSLLSLSSDWVWEQDAEGRVTYLSEGAGVALGRPLAEVLGRRVTQWEGFECEPAIAAAYREALARQQPFRHVVHGLKARDGTMRYVSISGEPVHEAAGGFIGYRGVGSDVTVATLAARQLTLMARFDVVTGLPNRAQFIEVLDRSVARARREDSRFALCFIDLDGFKAINDTHGHAAGDEVLKVTGRRLRELLRDSDFVARLGGDEFVAVLPGKVTPAGLTIVSDKLLTGVAAPIALGDHQVQVHASIGIALFPDDSRQAAHLLEQADAAMYLAKQEGRNQVRFYTGELARSAAQQFSMELDLRQTFAHGGLALHFQPRMDLADGRMAGIEALVRWEHPQRGAVPPLEFVALAEERGLILPLGRWVLDAACRQIRRWRDAGLEVPRCALNLSTHQLASDALYDDVGRALERHGLPATTLELEVTEAVVTAQHGRADALLHKLRALGVSIAIDDFGIGTSSLALIRRVSAQALKIDRSLVHRLPADEEAVAVTRASVALAHSLGLQAVAEGVESEAQLQMLREFGCDHAQGFLLGRPLPADAFAAHLRA